METVDIDFDNFILRVDEDRGVLYIDSKKTGATVIRICGLENQRETLGPVFQNCDITLTNLGLLIGMSTPAIKERT